MSDSNVIGGDKAKKYLESIAKKLGNGQILKVGFFDTEQYPDDEYVAAVAAENEFGSKTNPPRPFMRKTILTNKKEWPEMAAKGLKETDYDTDLVLGKLGQEIAGEVRQTIGDWSHPYPHNSPATIERKGFDDPLIDTHRMWESVTHILDDKL